MRCMKCGEEVLGKYCPKCGIEIKRSFCSECGVEVEGIFCPKCGKRVNEENINSEKELINKEQNKTVVVEREHVGKPKNKWIALLLCYFTFGGHKIYEGKILLGIVYICTLGFLGIGWIIDLIRILMKPNPYYVE